ncbi:MAG: hypothetical protein QOF00_4943 [Pseudonocardiales bacterium]|jgi:hypothetical protein|nr:hypothetical protein [Pseudonocardiales bacterium]
MRVLLRILAPLLGLALAAAGVLFVIEVVAAWGRPAATTTGLVVPWPDWRVTLETLSWADTPVPAIAIVGAVIGLLLVLLGMSARRADIHLEGPGPEITVTTAPRVLARLVGTRVRATGDVAAATVTASARKVSVSAQSWTDATPELRSTVDSRVGELLDELPLRRRPRVSVSLQERKGTR